MAPSGGGEQLERHRRGLGPRRRLGTERVEAEVRARFPDVRVARLDRDATAKAEEVTATIARIQRREVDVIIGTQMVAKGHDWPNVRLVGIVLADIALAIPDFRASERAMALLTQVAGRAGRGDTRGQVVLQTYDPTHVALRQRMPSGSG